MIKEKEINIHVNNIGFFGDHFEVIDLWMSYYGDDFLNNIYEKAKNKIYRVFYDKNKSEWKFTNNQQYGWYLLSRGDFDECIKCVVEEDENKAKTNAATEIFTIRREVNKKKRKSSITTSSTVTTFASYVEKCKKTYTKSEYDESKSCPMHKPFCVHACEFYNKSNNWCSFKCPNPYKNCSRCSHSYRLQFTDCNYEMCGYGTVKIIGRTKHEK